MRSAPASLVKDYVAFSMDSDIAPVLNVLCAAVTCTTPTSLKEAKQSPHWPQWKKAINREFDKLEERKVWGPLQPLPKGKRAHSGRLVFKRKSPTVLPPEVNNAGKAAKTKLESFTLNVKQLVYWIK